MVGTIRVELAHGAELDALVGQVLGPARVCDNPIGGYAALLGLHAQLRAVGKALAQDRNLQPMVEVMVDQQGRHYSLLTVAELASN
eukprot:980275-Prymnesium_polylepis.2